VSQSLGLFGAAKAGAEDAPSAVSRRERSCSGESRP
jgi:hypothetical protein